jgi:hypothetical protein
MASNNKTLIIKGLITSVKIIPRRLPFQFVMLNFSELPIDIYHVIHQYLLNYDYHEFLNTSKAVFSEVKYRTMHYRLRYCDGFDQADAGIISEIVAARVMNQNAQIFVTSKFDCRFYDASVVNSARLNLRVPVNVHTLKLQDCYNNDNLCFTGREGGYLHTLEICGQYRNDVEYDFSSISAAFPFLCKLVVNNCRMMSISPLLHIPYIKLMDVVLPSMKTSGHLSSDFLDVNLHQTQFHYVALLITPFVSTLSSFRDVQDLKLIADFVNSNSAPGYSLSCQFLTLIGVQRLTCFPLHLKKPKKLRFDDFDLKILMIDDITELEEVSLLYCSNVDMTLFRNAKKITIERRSFVNFENPVKISNLISFQFLSHVSLTMCDIVDASLFSNVRSVELKHCRNLVALEGLGKSSETRKGNRQVIVSNCPGISDFSPLNELHRVRVHNCVGFTDGNHVKDVSNLVISGCCNIESFHMFGKVYSLRIDRCNHLTTLFGLQDVPYLEISRCKSLKEIEGLKNNRYVEIHSCRSLNRSSEYYENCFSFLPHFSITVTGPIDFMFFFE